MKKNLYFFVVSLFLLLTSTRSFATGSQGGGSKGLSEQEFLVLETEVKNGIGDFVHLEEIFKLIRAKYPRINIGLHLYGEKKEGFHKEMMISFLKSHTKLMPGKDQQPRFCLASFKEKVSSSSSSDYKSLEPIFDKACRKSGAKPVDLTQVTKTKRFNLIVSSPTVTRVKNSLLEYGMDDIGMGVQNYGIRVYEQKPSFWHSAKNRAYKNLRIFPKGLSDWRALERLTGRQVAVLSSSEIFREGGSEENLYRNICERARQTKSGLDILTKIILLKPSIDDEVFYRRFLASREAKEARGVRHAMILQYQLDQICDVPVQVVYRDFEKDKDAFSQVNDDPGKKLINWWFGKIYIKSNDEFRAMSFYPYSGLAAGDDTLSQSISLSSDFPMLPIAVSSHGLHIRSIVRKMKEALDGKNKDFPKFPLLYKWLAHLGPVEPPYHTNHQEYVKDRRLWSTKEGFQKLLREWRGFQSWVKEKKNIRKNLETFFKNEMGPEFNAFIARYREKPSKNIKALQAELKRLNAELQTMTAKKLSTAKRKKKAELQKRIKALMQQLGYK